MPKYLTPRVPIQTPMFDERGILTRTWVIFFERLGLHWYENREVVEAGVDNEKATYIIYDTTAGANVTNVLPVRRGGTALDAEIVAKHDVAADFTFDILITRVGEDIDVTRTSIFGATKLTLPAGTPAGQIVSQTVFSDDPFDIAADDILSGDILESNGDDNVYTVVLKWSVG